MQDSIFKKTLPLTLISMLRFFGLFVVLPTISIHTLKLTDSHTLAGLVVGGYALTQILFQPIFGILGDKFNKKVIIFVGIVIFAIGSIICAYSSSIEMMIFGRLIQGVGAVGGVISAAIADIAKEEQRTKAMAIMGGGISISFLLAMILGPLIDSGSSMYSLFLLSAILSIISLVILIFMMPKLPEIKIIQTSKTQNWIQNKNLWLMNVSVFLQKAIMTSGFVIIPIVLTKHFGFSTQDLIKFYAPSAIIGILAMAPSAIFSEKLGKYKMVLGVGIVALGISYILMGFGEKDLLWVFIGGIVIFFIGFDIHEPILQSLTSKYAKTKQRSSALGAFNTFGFLGSFAGGVSGGFLYDEFGLFFMGIFIFIVCILWIISIYIALDNPQNYKNIYIENPNEVNTSVLSEKNGIVEYYTNDGTLTIKYDSSIVTKEEIETYIKDKN